MKIVANDIKLQYDENKEAEIVLKAKGNINIDDLKEIILKGKMLKVEIKQYRQKRSIDSNAYMWLLLNKMASVLKTTKDELYIEVLDRYGVYTHIVVKENVVDRVKAEWRTVRELGEVNINGKTGIQLQCYFGSSSYNTKEMSTLIEGVVEEAKELGIETVSSRELDSMKNAWGGNY
jgi:hypothetical protein